MMFNPNLYLDREYIRFVQNKISPEAVLGGSRALVHLGFNLKRTLGDYDFIVPKITYYQKMFVLREFPTSIKWKKQNNKIPHYSFQTHTCIFVNPQVRVIEYDGILCQYPEDILRHKEHYAMRYNIESKHSMDLKNLNRIAYTFNNL